MTRRALGRHADMTPLLKELHWLPVQQIIRFKILCIIFKAIHRSESAPCYLTEILSIDEPSYRTRNSAGVRLAPFSFKSHGKQASCQYGHRALSVAGPKLWNVLPSEIRSLVQYDGFKSRLKTFLFHLYYCA